MTVSLDRPAGPQPLRTVGQPIQRVEGAAKVTGGARYAADSRPVGALWAKILRSPVPHARIVRIDTSEARKLPGVCAVLTGQDVPDVLLGHQVKDTPILARDVVRYVGDRVAAVAAEDPETAEAALTLIDVEYEELLAVFDQVEAGKPSSPLLHPDFASYRRPTHTTDPSAHNLQTVTRFSKGDVEQGFAESDLIFEHEFRTQMMHQGYLEPRCFSVEIADDGRIHVWASDQAPYKLRAHLANAVGCPVEQIVVYPVSIGASFGAKDDVMDTPLVYFLAKAAGRPVTLLWTYTEELLYGTPRHGAVIRLKSGLKRDGRICAREGQVIYNGGGYASMKPNPEGNMTGGLQLGGSYNIPHTRLESRCMYTNQAPCGYMRSPGEAQVHFAVENHTDMIARELGMDPLGFRLLNCLRDGDVTPNGLKARDVHCEETLARAAEAAGWSKPRPASADGKLRGRGIALGDRHTGTSKASTKLVLELDGTVTLVSALADVGPGAHTIMQQIAAETLGIPHDQIRLRLANTDELPFDQGVKGMSATYSSGTSIRNSAEALIDALKRRAAAEWGVSSEQVVWEDGEARLQNGPGAMALSDLARLVPDELAEGSCTFIPPDKLDVLAFQAQVAEVAVDPDTGQITLERLVHAQDTARIINPITHRGQIEGSATQGVGYALMEELKVDQGHILTASLGDYKLPSIADIPDLQVEYVHTTVGPAPFESKGIAECGLSTVGPAVAAAIFDATGVRFTELPITAEKMRAALLGRERIDSSGSPR